LYRICDVVDCGNKHYGRGLCKNHHELFRKNGNPLIKKHEFNHSTKCLIDGCTNTYHAKGYCRRHYRKIEHPDSFGVSYEVTIAMNNVRKRDKNECKWFGCTKSAKKGDSMHINHIFPREKYPELSTIEKYMICYCDEHHAKFHKARGDKYHEFVLRRLNKVIKKCKINDCDNKSYCQEYCTMHYIRFIKYDDPLTVKRVQNHSRDSICVVAGCDKPHLAMGYCNVHYKKLRRLST
jgi:hypothetical protein